MTISNCSVAFTGSGGAGVVVTGEILLQAAGKAGLYGLLRKSFGPQIRGGESAAMIRLGLAPQECMEDKYAILIVFDWNNFSRFKDEIVLANKARIYADEKAGDAPNFVTDSSAELITVPFTSMAKQNKSSRPNMVILGFCAGLLGLPVKPVIKAAHLRLASKGDNVLKLAEANIQSGYTSAQHYATQASVFPTVALPNPLEDPHHTADGEQKARWYLSGNQAIAYGALKAGIKFVAAYPITPATDLLEWLADHIETAGGHLVQAEDELAAINMAIGASFGGIPSLTATSGPGLSLMSEALGLAITSETPVVVIDVMRGGPSTGIPTKSEQSDLNLALYGMHGDAPHVVIAPNSISDAVTIGGWATCLAEKLQTVVLVLSDQVIGQSITVIDKPTEWPHKASRDQFTPDQVPYFRYLDTQSGISPMAFPGDDGAIYTAEGLEHNERGTPSPRFEDHLKQLNKRSRKLQTFDFGIASHDDGSHDDDSHDDGSHEDSAQPSKDISSPIVIERVGQGDQLILCWGSVTAAAREAIVTLNNKGINTQLACFKLLSPLPEKALRQCVAGVKQIHVIEQNHSAQFYHYLKSVFDFDSPLSSMAIPGPIPLTAIQIVNFVEQAINEEKF